MHHAPDILKKQGHKLTPQRLLIWRIFEDGKHYTANQIHKKVQKEFPGVDLATVYRTLELLSKHNFVQENTLSSGPAQYEITNNIDHNHIVCTKCEKIEHFEDENLLKHVNEINKSKNFDTKSTRISVSSICSDCLAPVN